MSSSESGSSLTLTLEAAAAIAAAEDEVDEATEDGPPFVAAAPAFVLPKPATLLCWFLPSWLKKSNKVLAFT